MAWAGGQTTSIFQREPGDDLEAMLRPRPGPELAAVHADPFPQPGDAVTDVQAAIAGPAVGCASDPARDGAGATQGGGTWVPQMMVTPGTRNPWLEPGRQDCALRSGVYLGAAILAGQEAVSAKRPLLRRSEPPVKPTALGAQATGTQRDVAASDSGRYVLVCHRLAVANSRSTR